MEAANISISYIPSAMDVLLLVPRLVQKAATFALYHVPDTMDHVAGTARSGGSVIAVPTAHHSIANATVSNTSTAFAHSTASAVATSLRDAFSHGSEESGSFLTGFASGMAKLKNLGGIFSYMTSRWALTTFTAAVLLNRTQFYASSREHLRLGFHMRLALYLFPILAFLTQTFHLLQALRCQTSPAYPLLRYGDPRKHWTMDFAAEGGVLYQWSSSLLFWQDDVTACHARSMSRVGMGDTDAVRGSMSLLYCFFLTLCASQLFETLACALQGRLPKPETGMTIFEHSLAFAECEAMISSALGFGLFGLPRGAGSGVAGETGPVISRSKIVQRLNVPPEVLLVCLISCLSHISSASLAVAGIRDRVRLVNTAVWACCYMSAFLWSFTTVFVDTSHHSDLSFLRFPTVCLVGFIPYMLVMTGITACGLIYGIAVLVTAFSIPSEAADDWSLRRRFSWAYHNLHANLQFSHHSSVRIQMSEDFYTTLLTIGFGVLTAARDAVYLHEGNRIHIAPMTWLEQKRIDELAASFSSPRAPPYTAGNTVPSELLDSACGDRQHAAVRPSPYARERKAHTATTEMDRPNASEWESGRGITQRRSRIRLTGDFIAGILGLALSFQAQITLRLLHKLGVERRPSWLSTIAGIPEKQRKPSAHVRSKPSETLDFYTLDADGRLTLPRDSDVDVEVETRRMMVQRGIYQDEQHLGNDLYQWWRDGGWYGDLDGSGDYAASVADDDDDVTSVISMSTNASTNDEDEGESGRRTPTPREPYRSRYRSRYSRESTAEIDGGLDMGTLSRLLDPHNSADRDEARLLALQLQSDRPLTRSQYRRRQERSRAELLTGLRARAAPRATAVTDDDDDDDDDDDERDLEQFILSQRTAAPAPSHRASPWDGGGEGMGAGGPQCVVCQCSPRTVLVWPCGCLCMCDDCRVGLAARNYTQCICCRTDIAAYSRLYVP